MKKLLALLLVIPITAVVTAGATVVAVGVMWPERLPHRSSAPDPDPMPGTAIPADIGRPAPTVAPPAAMNAPELVASRALEVTSAGGDAGAEREALVDPIVTLPPRLELPNELPIDYVRLSDDIRQVSDVLERFNRKLTSRLAGTRGEAPADGSPAVALDNEERAR